MDLCPDAIRRRGCVPGNQLLYTTRLYTLDFCVCLVSVGAQWLQRGVARKCMKNRVSGRIFGSATLASAPAGANTPRPRIPHKHDIHRIPVPYTHHLIVFYLSVLCPVSYLWRACARARFALRKPAACSFSAAARAGVFVVRHQHCEMDIFGPSCCPAAVGHQCRTVKEAYRRGQAHKHCLAVLFESHKWQIERTADDSRHVLLQAVRNGDVAMLKQCFAHGASPSFSAFVPSSVAIPQDLLITVLRQAERASSVARRTALMQCMHAIVDAGGTFARPRTTTLFDYITWSSFMDREFFIAAVADTSYDLEERNEFGLTPLLARIGGIATAYDVRIVETLLLAGARADACVTHASAAAVWVVHPTGRCAFECVVRRVGPGLGPARAYIPNEYLTDADKEMYVVTLALLARYGGILLTHPPRRDAFKAIPPCVRDPALARMAYDKRSPLLKLRKQLLDL